MSLTIGALGALALKIGGIAIGISTGAGYLKKGYAHKDANQAYKTYQKNLKKQGVYDLDTKDAIDYLKELNYIDDSVYVDRAVKEFMALKNLSIKEMVYKICQKGVSKSIVDDYVCKNKETMLEYEISSAKNIIKKKQGQEEQEIKNFLYKKGFMSESVNIAFDELDDK